MSETSSKIGRKFVCRICDATVTQDEMDSHREFHKKRGDKVRRIKKYVWDTPIRNKFTSSSQVFPRPKITASAQAKHTELATKVKQMERSIRKLTKENGKQKERISAFGKEKKALRAEINVLKRRERERVKTIEKLNEEVLRLKAQQPEPTPNPGRNGRGIQQGVSRRGKATTSKTVPASTSQARTRASGKSGNATVTK